MHRSDVLNEADRLMTVCNSCRYCEGLCAVFPAMEMRRAFTDGDLDYLANLCHNCGACYVDCQFAPPHEFDVNVPRTLASVRAESYRYYAWPAALQPLFERNGVAIALAVVVAVAGFVLGFVAWHDPSALIDPSGQFYSLMPHTAMATLFLIATAYAVIALAMGCRAFWHEIGASRAGAGNAWSWWSATRDVASLRYLDGGGVGCYNENDRTTDNRRLFHHLTFYGFLLCFAATCAGTVYHYGFAMPAPYAWYQLPKLFGIPGGAALVVGTAGLMVAKVKRDRMMMDRLSLGMDTAFLVVLFLIGLSGLMLMLLRSTPAMGALLALHLGLVLAFLLTLPYGKFVHGAYRFAALALYAREQREAATEG